VQSDQLNPISKPIKEVAFHALGGGSVVILDKLEKVTSCEILFSRSGVLVVKARLHVFRKGEIESELAGVSKGESGTDSVGALKRDTLE
jgi:uncharacterized protein YjhX (UPF0386 family)